MTLGIAGLLLIDHTDSDGEAQTSDATTPSAADPLVEKVAAVESLRPLMTLTQFESRLGTATLKKALPAGTVEHVFVDPLYYVQAITDADVVMFFAVTTRSEAFSPRMGSDFNFPEAGPNSVVLGQQSFADAMDPPQGVHLAVGVHDFSYFEVYYMGNPGNYLTYVLGLNESGLGGISATTDFYRFPVEQLQTAINRSVLMPSDEKPWETSAAAPTLPAELEEAYADFRRTLRVNTFAIGGPWLDFSRLRGAWIGPNYNEVRVLD